MADFSPSQISGSGDGEFVAVGIIPEGIALALKVRSMYRWAADVPWTSSPCLLLFLEVQRK